MALLTTSCNRPGCRWWCGVCGSQRAEASRGARAGPGRGWGGRGAAFLSLRLRLWSRRESERICAGRAGLWTSAPRLWLASPLQGALRVAGDPVVGMGVGRPRPLCRHYSAFRQPPSVPLRQHLQYCWWRSSRYSSRNSCISSVAAFRRSAFGVRRPVRCARRFSLKLRASRGLGSVAAILLFVLAVPGWEASVSICSACRHARRCGL